MPIYEDNVNQTEEPLSPQTIFRPQTVEDSLDVRYTAMETMAFANYQRRMLNAGALYGNNNQLDVNSVDPVLMGYAETAYYNDMAKVEDWHRGLKGKLALIDKEQSFSTEEKDMIRNKVMSESKDPIYIPNPQQRQKPVDSQKEIRQVEADYDYYSTIISNFAEDVDVSWLPTGNVDLAILDKKGKPLREANPAEKILYNYAKQRLAKNQITLMSQKQKPPVVKEEKPSKKVSKKKTVKVKTPDGKIWELPPKNAKAALKRYKGSVIIEE